MISSSNLMFGVSDEKALLYESHLIECTNGWYRITIYFKNQTSYRIGNISSINMSIDMMQTFKKELNALIDNSKSRVDLSNTPVINDPYADRVYP